MASTISVATNGCNVVKMVPRPGQTLTFVGENVECICFECVGLGSGWWEAAQACAPGRAEAGEDKEDGAEQRLSRCFLGP